LIFPLTLQVATHYVEHLVLMRQGATAKDDSVLCFATILSRTFNF